MTNRSVHSATASPGRMLLWIVCLVTSGSLQAESKPLRAAIEALDLAELTDSYSTDNSRRVLGRGARRLPQDQWADAAVLLQLGLIERSDLRDLDPAALAEQAAILASGHPALLGRLSASSTLVPLFRPLDHEPLLRDRDFQNLLGELLDAGVLTGYDLRPAGIYDEMPNGLTYTYSHSSPTHLRQLITLLAREKVNGWVYVTAKTSAFLFREQWGAPGPNVVTLSSGQRVVEGREMAVLFRFDTAEDRDRFHQLVRRYAKRDTETETGLIADAWWQPFYYTDIALEGFEPIALLVVTRGEQEATLTVLKSREQEVLAALSAKGLRARVDRVWVNEAFYRFLNGDYR